MYLFDNYYTISEIMHMVYSTIITRLFYPRALLIRRPFYLRGKPRVSFGSGFTTGYGCRIEAFGNGKLDKHVRIRIGENCHLGDQVHIAAANSVSIGENCLFASKVFISDLSHGSLSPINPSAPDSDPNSRPLVSKPVVIGDNVWLGENVCVLSGVTIGNGSIVGANAVVTHDIPDGCVAAGVPASVIKRYDVETRQWLRL